MTNEEHIKRANQLVGEWFKDHSPSLVYSSSLICVIDWSRPGTSNYSVRFIISKNNLIVTGDCGEAIYSWSERMTPLKILSFDWHYFVGKCSASETGREYTMKIPGVSRKVVNVRAIAHFVGIQMALKQLQGQGAFLE